MINENTIFILAIIFGALIGVFITGIIFSFVYEFFMKRQDNEHEEIITDYEAKLEELEDEFSCVCEDLFNTQSALNLFYTEMADKLERTRKKHCDNTDDLKSLYASFVVADLCVYCDQLAHKYLTTDPEEYKDTLLKF